MTPSPLVLWTVIMIVMITKYLLYLLRYFTGLVVREIASVRPIPINKLPFSALFCVGWLIESEKYLIKLAVNTSFVVCWVMRKECRTPWQSQTVRTSDFWEYRLTWPRPSSPLWWRLFYYFAESDTWTRQFTKRRLAKPWILYFVGKTYLCRYLWMAARQQQASYCKAAAEIETSTMPRSYHWSDR